MQALASTRRVPASSHHVADHRAADVGEAEVTAVVPVGELLVVEAEQVQERHAFHVLRTFGKVSHRGTARIAVIENVEHEVVRTDLVSPDVVHVFHHQ